MQIKLSEIVVTGSNSKTLCSLKWRKDLLFELPSDTCALNVSRVDKMGCQDFKTSQHLHQKALSQSEPTPDIGNCLRLACSEKYFFPCFICMCTWGGVGEQREPIDDLCIGILWHKPHDLHTCVQCQDSKTKAYGLGHNLFHHFVATVVCTTCQILHYRVWGIVCGLAFIFWIVFFF